MVLSHLSSTNANLKKFRKYNIDKRPKRKSANRGVMAANKIAIVLIMSACTLYGQYLQTK